MQQQSRSTWRLSWRIALSSPIDTLHECTTETDMAEVETQGKNGLVTYPGSASPSSPLASRYIDSSKLKRPFPPDHSRQCSSSSIWPREWRRQELHDISDRSSGWFLPLGLGNRIRANHCNKYHLQSNRHQPRTFQDQTTISLHQPLRKGTLGGHLGSFTSSPSSQPHQHRSPSPLEYHNLALGSQTRRAKQDPCQETWAHVWKRKQLTRIRSSISMTDHPNASLWIILG